MRANPLFKPLEGVSPENLDFFGPKWHFLHSLPFQGPKKAVLCIRDVCPRSRIMIFTHPRSRSWISDLGSRSRIQKQQKKRGGGGVKKAPDAGYGSTTQQKSLDLQGPPPSNGPCYECCPHQNHYVHRHINNRYIVVMSLFISKLFCTKGCMGGGE